jgi:hypothetical protein
MRKCCGRAHVRLRSRNKRDSSPGKDTRLKSLETKTITSINAHVLRIGNSSYECPQTISPSRCDGPWKSISDSHSKIKSEYRPHRQSLPCGDDEVTMRPWLPNNSFPALDAAQKPYYCESKNICQGRIATMVLFGPAPVRSTRALPPTTGKSISASA